MIRGVDVSSYQSETFPLEIDGLPVEFAIIKVTQGTGYVNPRWRGQLAWARKNGLAVGFYHFGEAGYAAGQVAHFAANVEPQLQAGDTLWYDWESANGSAPTNAEKDSWIRSAQERFVGHRVGLYCNVHFWKNVDTTSFAGDALWIAQYGVPVGQPGIEHPWTIHQYSDVGIDHNVARFASKAELLLWAGVPGKPEQQASTVMEAVMRMDAKLDAILRKLGAA
ncbi:MAG TPA: glycoside hydrolase family 25 protein [Acidimicrobiia bacterium]|nr:glycoside hydrolase family 25 protein [Acidimicrobiia bacterium]